MQEIARIKKVICGCPRKNRGEVAREVCNLWTTPMPQCVSLWKFCEAEDFLDATIAVGCHNEDFTRKLPFCIGDPHDHVMMKFALLPMGDEFKCAEFGADEIEERSKYQRVGELLNHLEIVAGKVDAAS